MKIKSNILPAFDNCKNLHISGFNKLTGTEANALRQIITTLPEPGYSTIFINTKNVTEVDLTGINEIIHTNYTLQQKEILLILAYQKGSVIEKWMKITKLDKFVATALIPTPKAPYSS
ncbi:MAG: STAS domain-containing protein [Niabella sp.]